jgi:DnaJ-class molecular chaperone
MLIAGALILAPFTAAFAANGPCNLAITSEPSDAKVFINGKEMGVTPLSVGNQPRGTIAIMVSLKGYRTFTKILNLTPGVNYIQAKLVPAGGAAVVKKDPESEKKPSTDPVPPKRPEEEVPKTIQVKCPACSGSGLTKEIGCHHCQTTGHGSAMRGFQGCGECASKGWRENTCVLCRGEKRVRHRSRGEIDCPSCKGMGVPPCPVCKGDGELSRPNPDRASYPTKPCPSCAGTAVVRLVKCWECAGKGSVTMQPPVDITTNRLPPKITAKCGACRGKGQRPSKCRGCKSRGYVSTRPPIMPCRMCFGSGASYPPCRTCSGRGYVRDTKK